jgi:hypothetical protein
MYPLLPEDPTTLSGRIYPYQVDIREILGIYTCPKIVWISTIDDGII